MLAALLAVPFVAMAAASAGAAGAAAAALLAPVLLWLAIRAGIGARQRLQKTALELQAIFENASVGFAFTRNRRFERCSPAFRELFGYAPGELESQPGSVVWPSEEDYAALGRDAGPLLLAGKPYVAERRARRKDGSLFCARVLARAVQAGDPSRGTIWMVEDITEKKQAEERLFAEKERAQATLQAIGDAVIVTDVEGRVEFMNPEAEALAGTALADAAGRPIGAVLRLADEAGEALAEDPAHRVLRGGAHVAKASGMALLREDGTLRSVEYSAAPIRNRAGEVDGVVVALRDVTEQHAMAEQVSWQASHDALTGLINRHEFERRVAALLEDSAASGRVHVLLFLDLDQFKVVNDTCGHAAGDELLRQVSRALAASVRQSDALARLGGDEFGVLLCDCPVEPAQRAAEALRRAVEEFCFSWQDKRFKVGVSIGGVVMDETTRTLAQVLSTADAACYLAKDSGRNRVHLVAGDDHAVVERHGQMEWVSRIHKAIEEDRFCLHYQSIVPVGGGAEEGDHFELLLRMVDEANRPVPPMAFIPAAERYHLMPAIDRWVVRTAFRAFARGYAPGGGRRLATAAINLSGATITDPNFLGFLREQFAEHGVPPARICFEVTETATIANLTRAGDFIAEMKRLGCRFSLDDFGSGMSSFAYLKNLPVDYLKIDGGFVKDMHNDPIDAAMVEAIHRIGHVMGIATIAEFVESEEILARLRAIGVDYAQGFGIARPRPLAELLPAPRVALAA